MPLGIDLVFKWGNQKKKDEKPPEKPASSESEESCSSCNTTCSSVSRLTHSAVTSAASKADNKSKEPPIQETQNETYSESNKHGQSKRLLIFIRHAERMDRIFPSWLNLASVSSEYRPYDKNQPRKIPQRKSPMEAYLNDPPLTRQGQITSVQIGKSIEDAKIQPAFIYCSPALRCIETANQLLQGLSAKPKIRIEPGLYDWLGFFMDKLPVFMSTQELQSANFDIDHNYKPIVSTESLLRHREETSEEFYRRINNVTNRINKTSTPGTVLIVAHSSTLDAGVRAILKLSKSVPTFFVLDTLCYKYPYCSAMVLEENDDGETFKESKALPNQNLDSFDMNFLLRSV